MTMHDAAQADASPMQVEAGARKRPGLDHLRQPKLQIAR